MKVLQISTVCGSGSVGRITVDIYHTLEKNGDIPLIAYGRRSAPEGLAAYRFGSPLDMGLHVLSTFFKGEHGFASDGQTRKLIQKMEEWKPDVIHLHNIHGFVLQVELLFDYLKRAGKPVVWTLHDCWSYTGHCAFYDYHNCDGWQNGCTGCREYRRTYPYALFRNRTPRNFERKRAVFTGMPDLVIVTPSQWLAGQVRQSFLGEYPVKVIPNGIDLETFRPVRSSLRERLGLEGKYVILGVANVWERRKGLEYFVELAGRLPEDCRIVLVGLSKKQQKGLPVSVVGLGRTSGAAELAEYYSMADVFVNATLEDNFPTTNLEALSCGTPVITFRTGGSPESVDEDCGIVVEKGNVEELKKAIEEVCGNPEKYSKEKMVERAQRFRDEKMAESYWKHYLKMFCGKYH